MYIESILALQQKACVEQGTDVMLEMVIMTSDDTHSKTQALLDKNRYFGMKSTQLHLVKQEKVGHIHCKFSIALAVTCTSCLWYVSAGAGACDTAESSSVSLTLLLLLLRLHTNLDGPPDVTFNHSTLGICRTQHQSSHGGFACIQCVSNHLDMFTQAIPAAGCMSS